MSLSVEQVNMLLERADKHERTWREVAYDILKRYRGKQERDEEGFAFNILWANTETQRPALYSSTPVPAVTRRFLDQDPVGKAAAWLVERGLEYAIDPGNNLNFDAFANECITDFLLAGRAVARVKYVPTFATTQKRIDLVEEDGSFFRGFEEVAEGVVRDEQGPHVLEDTQETIWEEVIPERVSWTMFRMDPEARCWKDVGWVAFATLMTEKQVIKKFGKQGKTLGNIPLDFNDSGDPVEGEKGVFAKVWEFWFKGERRVYYLIKGADKFLDRRDDPLNLVGFFPMPAPAYIIPDPESMIPRPEFVMYQDQADEVDIMTARIASLMTAIKLVGIGPGDTKDVLFDIADASDGQIRTIADWPGHLDKGGLKGMIDWMPIDDAVKVVQVLISERQDLIQQIFELTGISDIQRGASDPRETRGAQVIKATFAGRRLLPKQRETQRFFRDLFRIMAEIMVEQFAPDVFLRMTKADQNFAKQVIPQVLQTLKDDKLRAFAIDIETDSTIAPDEQKEKQERIEVIQAMAQFGQLMTPLVASNPAFAGAAMQLLLWSLKPFKVSRQIEDVLIQAMSQPARPDPRQQQDVVETQLKEREADREDALAASEVAKNIADAEDKSDKSVIDLVKVVNENLRDSQRGTGGEGSSSS